MLGWNLSTSNYWKKMATDAFPTFPLNPWGDRIIWEHLGMLVVPEYKASWERKLKFYEEIGYTLGENLFTTCDHENGAIMTEEVEDVIRKIKEQL